MSSLYLRDLKPELVNDYIHTLENEIKQGNKKAEEILKTHKEGGDIIIGKYCNLGKEEIA